MSTRKAGKEVRWLGLAGIIVGADQLIKWWWQTWGREVRLNQGIAGGVLAADMWWVVAGAVVVYLWVRQGKGWWLVVGGGVSNLIDRLVYGGVRDIWQLPLLPTFNLADVAIMVGVLWILK